MTQRFHPIARLLEWLPECDFAVLEDLRSPPGYLNGLQIPSSQGPLHWRSAGEESRFAGKSLLTTSGGVAVAISDFHCYVRPVAGHRMLVWYHAATNADDILRIQLFDADGLLPLGDPHAAAARLGPGQRLLSLTEPVAAVEFSTSLSDGSHALPIPESLRGLGELLLLAPSTADGRRQDHFSQMRQRLWSLDTASGALRVAPQDWFNQGPYDFGYQWITRMARLPDVGEIVGEGIRLGVFRLDSSCRQIAEWLVTDTFYHPEREPFDNASPEA